MEPDLDDTRRAVLRRANPQQGPDVDQTIVRGPVAAPPELVEPPEPPRPRLADAARRPVETGPAAPEHPRSPGLGAQHPEPQDPEPQNPEQRDPEADAGPRIDPLRAAFPDGTHVTLDVPVYVGRRPQRPRIPTASPPLLVALPSPTRELSATHLELRTVGTTAVASDLRSTNGTVVQLPGAAPRTLVRGESVVVVAGTRIDLGDGAVIDILPPLTESS